MKTNKNMNEEEFFKNVMDSIPEDVKQSVSISMAIASQINSVLKKKNISQREFAALLNKNESEISKWLSGNHNFTTNTLGKIQAVLGEEIISVPLYFPKEVKFVPVLVYSHSFQSLVSQQQLSYPVFNKQLFSAQHMIINCNMDCHATESVN